MQNNYTGLPDEILASRFNKREYQIQRKNHFTVQFDSNFVDSNLEFFVVSFSLPRETTETFRANFWNDGVNLPGKTTFESSELVLRDAINWDTEKQFMNWRLKVYNPKTGTVGYAEDFKCNATVCEYSPSGDKIRSWTLMGCFPQAVNYGDITYEDGGEKQISVTIMYDRAYRNDI